VALASRFFDEGHTVNVMAAGPEFTQEAIFRKVEGALVMDLFDATKLGRTTPDGRAF
jgi:hypothetical protein